MWKLEREELTGRSANLNEGQKTSFEHKVLYEGLFGQYKLLCKMLRSLHFSSCKQHFISRFQQLRLLEVSSFQKAVPQNAAQAVQ